MVKFRIPLRWMAGLAVAGLFALVLASGKAADLLKSVTDLRLTLYKQAQDKNKADGTKIDLVAIQAQVRAKAEESLKGVDSAKVEPTEALEWAQLFNIAGRTQDTQTLLVSFIQTKPEQERLYQAQTMLLSASLANHDSKTAVDTLQTMKPYSPLTTMTYATLVSNYAPRLADKLGAENAISLIDKAVAGVQVDQLTDAQKKSYESLKVSALTNEVGIYTDAGRKQDALKLIDQVIGSTSDVKAKTRLTITRNQLTLVGTPAPSLKVERGYGDFPGLASLKGKVVVLDFFAHWCGPCIRAFPEMRQLFADLQPKGLQVVGITTYYGYYEKETGLTPDQEYAKMADFMKDKNMTWPVVYGPRENFEAYGVTGIPHVVVIGRDGVVHNLDIGYSPALFAKFRKDVEALIAQK